MVRKPDRAPSEVADDVVERRLVAMHLQSIEDSPLDGDDIAMFEMFEREGWSQERRREHIRRKALAAAFSPAAE